MKKALLTFFLVLLSAVTHSPALAAGDEPLFVVTVKGKRGYIDRSGKVVIEPRFDGASAFAEGLALVAIEEPGLYKEGYIDKTGVMVIEARFDRATDFSEGLAAVGIGEFGLHDSGDHHWGFIDRTGRLVIRPQFRDVLPFSEGLAAARDDEGKWGFIDRAGDVIVPFRFSDAGSFSEGLAPLMIENKWGYVDPSGAVIIALQYAYAVSFSEGLALVRRGGEPVRSRGMVMGPLGGQYLFIDKAGRTVIELGKEVEHARSFSEGLAAVGIRGNGGFIDRTGELVIPARFGGQSSFSEGLVFVILSDGKIGFIDKTGNVVLRPKFALAQNFRDGLAPVSDSLDISSARYGYIDKVGRVVWAPSN